MTKPLFRKSSLIWIVTLMTVQSLCALFFVSEFVTEVFGLRNWAVTWEIRKRRLRPIEFSVAFSGFGSWT